MIKKKCNQCNKKIKSLFPYECKCHNYYCIIHKYEHNCTYDYKNEYEKILKINNIKVEGKKLERI